MPPAKASLLCAGIDAARYRRDASCRLLAIDLSSPAAGASAHATAGVGNQLAGASRAPAQVGAVSRSAAAPSSAKLPGSAVASAPQAVGERPRNPYCCSPSPAWIAPPGRRTRFAKSSSPLRLVCDIYHGMRNARSRGSQLCPCRFALDFNYLLNVDVTDAELSRFYESERE